MQQIRFRIDISAQRLAEYYRGKARQVQVVSDDGRQVRFPAEKLRPFVTASGVQGYFEISYNEYQKFTGLKQLSS